MTQPTWFVATIWCDKYDGSKEDLRDWLMAHHAKEGVIGRELSPTSGKYHFQCKFHLDRGESLDGWKALIGPIGHVEIAAEKSFTGYEEKDGDFVKWPSSPIDRFKDLELCTWQRDALTLLENQNDRKILCIVDEVGGSGKSTFGKHLEAIGMMDVCPVVSEEYNDYTGYCFEFPSKGYIFDVPRAILGSEKQVYRKTQTMYAGIEQIKNGLIFEKRYKPRKMWIEPPRIMVYTNAWPDESMLSRDRWQYINPSDYTDTPWQD